MVCEHRGGFHKVNDQKGCGVTFGNDTTKAFSNNFGVGIDNILNIGKCWCTTYLYSATLQKDIF
jgi:hypothetical protein